VENISSELNFENVGHLYV